jgi:hypothetical protein
MSLPGPWVDKIFEKMLLTYGSTFSHRWSSVEVDRLKADWAHELSGFQQNPAAIAYGLQHLPPERPPTVLQFRASCLLAPELAPKQLPAPPADPKVVAVVMDQMKAATDQMRATTSAKKDPRAWAYALKERDEAQDEHTPPNERITITQRTMYKNALRPVQEAE